MMKAKELRNLTAAELRVKLREIQEQLLQLRLRKQTGQVERTHELRALRKDIARILTILTELKRAESGRATVAK
jgi:large subunit ribosomal protein L29